MSVSLRLSRGGSKKRPFFRIVAADIRAPRDGRYIERLGTYNPMREQSDPERVNLNLERIIKKHFLEVKLYILLMLLEQTYQTKVIIEQ